jgi:hypothetical protein
VIGQLTRREASLGYENSAGLGLSWELGRRLSEELGDRYCRCRGASRLCGRWLGVGLVLCFLLLFLGFLPPTLAWSRRRRKEAVVSVGSAGVDVG